jgi:hypothetical protein
MEGYDSEVLIDQVVGGDDEDDAHNPALLRRLGLCHQEIRLLASQVTHLRRKIAHTRVEHERQFGRT